MVRMLATLVFLFSLPTIAFMLSDNPLVAFIPIILIAPFVLLASKLLTERGQRRRYARVTVEKNRE